MYIDIHKVQSILNEGSSEFGRFKHWILFGADQGHVSIIRDKILSIYKKKDPGVNIVRHEYSNIKKDLAVLNTDLSTSSLFGGSTIVMVENYTDSCPKDMEKILQNANINNHLIIVGNEFKKNNKLRSTTEKIEHVAVINCYKQDTEIICSVIRDYMQNHNLDYENDIPEFLARTLPNDRRLILNELEKLLTYSKINHQGEGDVENSDERENDQPRDGEERGKKLKFADVKKLIADEAETSLDELCFAIMIENKTSMVRSLKYAYEKNFAPVMILRVLQQQLAKAIEVKLNVLQKAQNPKAISRFVWVDAIRQIKPPIFGKMQNYMLEITSKIRLKNLRRLLVKSIEIERLCKSGVLDDQKTLMSHLLTHHQNK